ncbi:MAG TPA: hypothetical protein VEY88_19945 [Archangium sp.]|nr:hypothetical protein [Archangium sp.]
MKTIEANTTKKHSRAFWAIQGAAVLLQLLQLLAALYTIHLTLP